MRAVNLIPVDARRGGRAGRGSVPLGAGHAVVFALAVAVVLVLVGVLTSNTISSRRARLADLRAQVVQVSVQAAQLSKYTQFEQLAQQRAETVRQIAASRFNWQRTLAQLSKVVPANTSFQSLAGTVVPGAGAGSGGSGGAAGGTDVRGAITAPAFEISGCTASQDDVARLMSRLRLMSGVTRVTLGASTKNQGSATGTSPATGSGEGCRPNAPSFNLVVFFTPVPNAGPTGVANVSVGTAATTAEAAR